MINDYTYIVTGCTGYVGNVLTKKLLSLGLDVIGLARSQKKVDTVFGDNKPTIVFGDVRNKDDLRKLFIGDKPFVVIHTAAYITIESNDKTVYDINVGGTKNMLDVAKEFNTYKFIHISSTEAMPHKLVLNKEISNYIPNPKNSRKGYSRAKCLADQLVLFEAKNNNLNACILLLAGVLGPGDYSNSHMTQLMIDFINKKLPASVNGGYNDFDIRDLADVLPEVILKSRNAEFYLFANKPDKINEVLSVVSKVTGRKMVKTLPLWVAYVGLPFLYLWSKIRRKRPLYTSTALASLKANTNYPLDKVKTEFGYNPRPLEETVKDHVKFLIEKGMVKL